MAASAIRIAICGLLALAALPADAAQRRGARSSSSDREAAITERLNAESAQRAMQGQSAQMPTTDAPAPSGPARPQPRAR